ncbi:MAG: precorrin-2 C(20)-methyltransferase [Oscillospiraceae bacterium]|jgi:sirohydrochlorin cobaltochelatase
MTGTLFGISVGPGDPELMTLKAVKLIRQCDIIAAPQTRDGKSLALSIARQTVDLSDKMLVYLPFLMTDNKDKLSESHHHIANQLLWHLKDGKNVGVLNLGDISVYSTFSYIAEIISSEGMNIEICAGVTSFCAAAAELKTPLVSGKEALTIIPGQNEEINRLVFENGTKVIMKSGGKFESIKRLLAEKKQVAFVENCGLENQKISLSPDENDTGHGYFTLIIVK